MQRFLHCDGKMRKIQINTSNYKVLSLYRQRMYICYAITNDPQYDEICKQADALVNLYNKRI